MRKFLSGFGFLERGNLKLSIRNILDNKEIITYELKVNQRKSFMWNKSFEKFNLVSHETIYKEEKQWNFILMNTYKVK